MILHFPQVQPHHFTNFTLHVTNIIGNTTAQVILLKGKACLLIYMVIYNVLNTIYLLTAFSKKKYSQAKMLSEIKEFSMYENIQCIKKSWSNLGQP